MYHATIIIINDDVRLLYRTSMVLRSAGDLLRAERQSGSELAEMINSYIVEGKLRLRRR
jgi:hypothetical protein